MTPLLAFLLGAAGLAGLAVPLFLWQRRRLALLSGERSRLAVEVERRAGVLAAAPDGIFIWDRVSGTEGCSRRLAVLLGLAAGTKSRFQDVRARFEGAVGNDLDQAVADLRRSGQGFDLVLPLGTRTIQAVGSQARAADGRPLADVLWMRDVTGLSPAAAASRARDGAPGPDEMRAALDALPFPVWMRGADLGIAFRNPAGAAIPGFNPGTGGLAGPAAALASQARAQGEAVSLRQRVGAEGEARLLEVTEVPLGKDAGTVGFAVERTDSLEREQALRRQTAAHHQVLESLAVAIAIYAADKRLSFFNRAFALLWRLDEAWLGGRPDQGEVLDRLHDHRRLPEVADYRAFRAEQLALFETLEEPRDALLHLPDGRTIRGTVHPHVTGGLIFTYEDMSSRLELERSFKTLNAVQRETIDHLGEGIAVFGGDGRLKLSNPVFGGLWGLSPDELAQDMHVADFVDRLRPSVWEAPSTPAVADRDDWPRHKARVLARLMGREVAHGTLRRTDGRVVRYANVPLPDGAVLLTYLDITDSVRVEEALRERAAALQEANRLKSEFIADVSHEVRTPLTTIIGFAEILNEGYFGDLSRRQAEYARGILDTSLGLMAVIGDILDLASIEAGVLTLDKDAIELHGMLASVLKLIQERARRKELHLEFDCPPDIGWLTADEKRLRQVLFHLLSNAVAFTPRRGGVRLSASREGDDVVLAVADTGVGIPEADRERVFKTFERGRPLEREPAGAGLGLSLVRSFVELHGGAVGIKSQPGRGTTVVCRLPAGGVGARDAFRT